jgi:hypothetical protein
MNSFSSKVIVRF